MKKTMSWMTCLVVGALALGAPSASAAPPLIYEGILTTGDDRPPDPWPGLRFSVVDAEGVVWWSTVIEPGGPHIDVGPDGRFVAWLEDSPENPLTIAGFDEDRWLRVDVCPGEWPPDAGDGEVDCAWVQLERTQRIGTVPMAATLAEDERARLRAEVMDEVRADIWVQPDVPGGSIATLDVGPVGSGSAFHTVREALDSIRHKLIPPGLTLEVRIRWAPETYQDQPSIVIDRPDGRRLSIIGMPAPEEGLPGVRLQFVDRDGIRITAGSQLGSLQGVALLGQGDGGGDHIGLRVDAGAHVSVAPDVIIAGFDRYCIAAYGGYVEAREIAVSDCDVEGIFATGTAFVDVTGASSVHLNGSFQARSGSVIIANSTFSDQGVGPEYDADGQSYIEADWSCRDSVQGCDYRAGYNSAVYVGRRGPFRDALVEPDSGGMVIR